MVKVVYIKGSRELDTCTHNQVMRMRFIIYINEMIVAMSIGVGADGGCHSFFHIFNMNSNVDGKSIKETEKINVGSKSYS